ncbi:hypothetical protein [Fodinicola acaciae]|uniref:hypothetical protein n=1 Tax=Fodinicola acaciae TaxID=2681555 RepID=UPI0013D2F553|nr:hypothetical protein [Fodinicola acaciae]
MSEHTEYDSAGNEYDVYEHSDGSSDIYEHGVDGTYAHDQVDADGEQHITAYDSYGNTASENVNSDGTVNDVHETTSTGHEYNAYNNYDGTYNYNSN